MLIGDGALDLHDGLQQHGGGEAQDSSPAARRKAWSLICL